MLHPTLESLLFLSTARETIADSIDLTEGIDNKQELKSYVVNEASDFEIMHLLTLGEMPELKFEPVTEEFVWDIFRKSIVAEYANLQGIMREEELQTMIFEMGPVAEQGLSSAKPILEFARANGQLDLEVLEEGSYGDEQRAKTKAKRDQKREIAGWKNLDKKRKAKAHSDKIANDPHYREKLRRDSSKKQLADIKHSNRMKKAQPDTYGVDYSGGKKSKVQSVKDNAYDLAQKAKGNPAKAAGYAAGGAAIAAAVAYGAKKLYSAWKNRGKSAEEAKAKQKASLKAGMSKCKGDAKCKAALQKKISALG